jgi:mono/diheme cytochrome c family protein
LPGETRFPDGLGKDTFLKTCGQCHSADVVVGKAKSREGWEATVDDMVAKGATGSDEELREIIDYLAKNFGKPGNGKIDANAGALKFWDYLKKVPQLKSSFRKTAGQ